MISRLKFECSAAILALQFLTRVPLGRNTPYSEEAFAESVRYYPLIGSLIGAVVAIVYLAVVQVFSAEIAVLLSTICGLILTGAFHEDGLADMFDGIGGGQNVSQTLSIMKDSRIGVYGAAALVTGLLLKTASLSELPSTIAVFALIAAHSLSRFSSVMVIATSRYVRDEGKSKPVAKKVSAFGITVATLTALAVLLLLWHLTSGLLATTALVGLVSGHVVSRLFYERKLRGYTGDCLGATQQFSEIGVYLGVLACL